MDALSALLKDVHLRDANFYYIHGHGDWDFHLNLPPDMMAFYVTITGHFNITINGQNITTKNGDMIMLPHSRPHVSYKRENDLGTAILASNVDLISMLPVNHLEPIQLGKGYMNAQLIMVLCRYDKEMAKPLLSALPVILPEPQSDQAPTNQPILQRTTNNTPQSNYFNEHSEILQLGLAYLSVEARTNRLGKTTMLNRLISMLMVECMREHIENLQDDSDSWLLALKDSQLAKAIAAMHARPDKNWTIQSLAEVAGMSRSSFADRFKSVVGEPPLSYLTSYRLRLAARFLRLEQYSIGRISEMVGYASDSTFSQAFKREYKLSPMQYRQEHGGGD